MYTRANSFKNLGNNLVFVLLQYNQYLSSVTYASLVNFKTKFIRLFCFFAKSGLPNIISLNFSNGDVIKSLSST